jgi:hypothetical protein
MAGGGTMSGVAVAARRLKVGGRMAVTLAGIDAAGFHWSALVEDPAVLAVERTAVESADEVFALTGLAAGETAVRFSLGRSSGALGPPREVREMRILVQAK